MNLIKRALSAVAASAVAATCLSVAGVAPAEAQPTGLRALVGAPVLSATSVPAISGTPAVGSLLALSGPTWSLPGVSTTYVWRRDGVAIPGATGATYTPTTSDAGHALSALVTGTVLGLLPVSVPSNDVTVPTLPGTGTGSGGGAVTTLAATTLPVLSGTPAVGNVLAVSPVAWNLPGVTTTIQWLADGSPIAGATGASLPVTSALAGSTITAQVTGLVLGLLPATVLSDALAVPPGTGTGPGTGGGTGTVTTLAAQTVPMLSGVPAVGNALSITPVTWNLPGVTTTVQWLSDNVAVPGATGSTLPITSALAGTSITALVTGTLAGLLPVSVLTDALGVPALPGTGTGTGGGTGTITSLVATVLPSLSGVPVVGNVLSVSPVTWNLPGVTTTIQWFSGATAVPGATGSLLPLTSSMAGTNVTALVTGTLAGLPAVKLLTGALGVSGLVGGDPASVLAALSLPLVSGDGTVGSALTGTGPTWSLAGVTTQLQWLRDGVAIPGATSSSYAPTLADVGHLLSLQATGVLGLLTGLATSAPLSILDPALTATTAPAITGAARSGGLLSVTPGAWSGLLTPTFAYQWYRSGRGAIPGATGAQYVLTPADAGHAVAVLVTATRLGLTGTAPSNLVRVAKLATRTQLAVVKKRIPARARGLVRLTLSAVGAKPSGQVKVYDGRRVVGRYTVRPADNGTRIVRLARLRSGTHQLRAAFAGSRTAAPSRSSTTRLVVARRP